MGHEAQQARALRWEVTDDGYALVTFDQPESRANTLNQAVLGELEEIVERATAAKDVRGLIFRSGKPGMFVAGADLKELSAADLDADKTRQLLQRGLAVIAAFEQLPYPTVVLIDGACMGGGTELALGFDYRLAGSSPKVSIGLPEVKIGLIPGWGGTQRLPRIIGPSLAAELICAGETVTADKAKSLGIVFDAVPSERLVDEAKRILAWTRESGDWQKQRQRKRQPVGVTEDQLGFTEAVARAVILQKTKGQVPAPLAALEAIVKGCNLPLDEGLAIESERFIPLAGSTVSRNLIAVFFMNQRLSKDTGVEDAAIQPGSVESVAVVGAGIMGSGIAGAHVRRSIPAVMVDKFPEALEKGVISISKMLQSRASIGRMSQDEVLAALAILCPGRSLRMIQGADVVIEAIIEDEATKVALFREIQDLISDQTIIASNTSTISITRMAESVRQPARFAGMHFFNPVDRMPLVEVIRGEKTSDETVVTLVAHAKRLKKTPIVVRDCAGFLVNRILFPYLNEAMLLLEEGADPRRIDRAAEDFGMPMGPITLTDMVGLDTSLFAGRVIAAAYPEVAVTSGILEDLVQAGRLGKKSGAGFYSYSKGGRGADDPELEQFLSKHRREQRKISQEELTDRLFLPMLTEASRTLMDRIVRSAEDVDMGLILGIGFPAHRGGILRWADTVGLPRILEKLEKYRHLGRRFHPTEQMEMLVREGRGFYTN